MKKYLVCSFALLILCGMGGQAYANVFAGHLEMAGAINIAASTTVTITYRLNEAADNGVEVHIIGPVGNMPQLVRILDSSETNPAHQPGSAAGENTVVWDGNTDSGSPAYNGQYLYKVVASDDGYSAWTNITPMQVANPDQPIEPLQPYNTKGIACIKDQSDPNFGKILFSHHWEGTSSNPGDDNIQPNLNGVYRLYNDYTYVGGTRADGFGTGNAILSGNVRTDGTYSPWKLKQGLDDGRLYLCDFNDGYENVWLGDTDWSTVTQLMESADAYGVGGTENHGNMSGIGAVGTGAETKMYALDEDLKWGACAIDPVIGFNIYRWDIGTTVSNYEAMPAELVLSGSDDRLLSPGFVNVPDMDILPNGNIFVVSERWDPAGLAAICYDPVSATPVWQKVGNDFTNVPTFGSGYFRASTYDSHKDVVYVIRRYGELYALDPDDGTELFGGDIDLGDGSGYMALATDAAGNVITSDYSGEHTWIWSPDDGPNSFETTGIAKITVSGGDDKPISTGADNWEAYH